MAKDENKAAAVIDPMSLMDKSPAELKVKRSRSTVDWDKLPDELKAKIGKKIQVNNHLAGQFGANKTDSIKFFEIEPDNSDTMTPVYNRGQKVTLIDDDEKVVGQIVGFKQTGSNKKFSYKDGELALTAKASGMSAVVLLENGKKREVSLNRITVDTK